MYVLLNNKIIFNKINLTFFYILYFEVLNLNPQPQPQPHKLEPPSVKSLASLKAFYRQKKGKFPIAHSLHIEELLQRF